MPPDSLSKIDTCVNTVGVLGLTGMGVGSLVLYFQGTAHELLSMPVDIHVETQVVGISTVAFLGAMLARYMRGKNITEAPELPVLEHIVDQEREFDQTQGPSRKAWLLNYVRLCEEGLDVLGQTKRDSDMDSSWANYVTHGLHTGPCKKVVISLPCLGDIVEIQAELEKLLKLSLHSRGANAGVFYRLYKENGIAFAEAIPATLTGE